MSKKLIVLLVICCLLLVALVVSIVLFIVIETRVFGDGSIGPQIPSMRQEITLWGRIAPFLIIVLFLAFMSCLLSMFTIWLSDRKRKKEIKQGEK